MKLRNIALFFFVLSILLLTIGCDEVPTKPDIDSPTDLMVTVVTEGRINLTWEYLKQTTGIRYVIGRKVGDGEWIDEYGESTGKSFVDDIPTNSYTVYSYKVKGVSADGETSSFFSEPVAYLSPLTAPTDLNIDQVAQNELKLSWKDNAIGETGYRIDRKIGDGKWTEGYKTVPANTTSFKDNFNDLFVSINYRVYAYAGTSITAKEEISFTPVYPKPTNPSIIQLSPTEVKFNWAYEQADRENIEGFEVYRKIGTTDWIPLTITNNQAEEVIDVPNHQVSTLAYRVRSYKDTYFSAFSDPVELHFNITPLGSLTLSDIGNKLHVDEDKAYIANDFNGISTIDLSNPSNPRINANIQLPDRTTSIDKKGNLLVAGSFNGRISFIDLNDNSIFTQLETKNPVYDIKIIEQNDIVYLLIANGSAGLLVASYDKNDPTDPKVISRYNTYGSSQSIAAEGNNVYLGDGYGGVLKFDISDPSKPVKTGENNGLGNCIDLNLLGNNLYVSTGSTGMKVVDKNSLQLINYFDTPGYVIDSDVTNRYAFIADNQVGLYLVSITNDLNLYSLSLIPSEYKLTSVKTKGNYIYLLSESSLQIIQVSS
jgi:hypothetical protein